MRSRRAQTNCRPRLAHFRTGLDERAVSPRLHSVWPRAFDWSYWELGLRRSAAPRPAWSRMKRPGECRQMSKSIAVCGIGQGGTD
jgi:hypothetical protein